MIFVILRTKSKFKGFRAMLELFFFAVLLIALFGTNLSGNLTQLVLLLCKSAFFLASQIHCSFDRSSHPMTHIKREGMGPQPVSRFRKKKTNAGGSLALFLPKKSSDLKNAIFSLFCAPISRYGHTFSDLIPLQRSNFLRWSEPRWNALGTHHLDLGTAISFDLIQTSRPHPLTRYPPQNWSNNTENAFHKIWWRSIFCAKKGKGREGEIGKSREAKWETARVRVFGTPTPFSFSLHLAVKPLSPTPGNYSWLEICLVTGPRQGAAHRD